MWRSESTDFPKSIVFSAGTSIVCINTIGLLGTIGNDKTIGVLFLSLCRVPTANTINIIDPNVTKTIPMGKEPVQSEAHVKVNDE